jgi:hypothetical protein
LISERVKAIFNDIVRCYQQSFWSSDKTPQGWLITFYPSFRGYQISIRIVGKKYFLSFLGEKYIFNSLGEFQTFIEKRKKYRYCLECDRKKCKLTPHIYRFRHSKATSRSIIEYLKEEFEEIQIVDDEHLLVCNTIADPNLSNRKIADVLSQTKQIFFATDQTLELLDILLYFF